MRRQSWLARTVVCVPALLGAASLVQCGTTTSREFGKGDSGAAGVAAQAGSATTPIGGRSGLGGGTASSSAGADANGLSGDGGSLAEAGTSGAGGSDPSPVGSQCAKNSDCELSHCVDGVCCESACAGCDACSSTLTGKSDGSCAPVLDGQDPHDTCPDVTAANECGTDGACNGASVCRKVSSSHVCKAAACAGGSFTPPSTCDGLGACSTPAAESCGASQCAQTGCLKSCSTQAECSATSYCKIASGSSGTCTTKNANGTPATQTFECASGVVADGVCCDQACIGCKACSGPPLTSGAAGQCLNVVAGKVAHSACAVSGTTCGLDGFCDGAGACRSTPLQGQACTPSNLCLTGTTCHAGTCSGGMPKICDAPAACKNQGVCAPATGLCSYSNQADNNTCNDNNGCTSSDKCTNGTCGGALCPTTSNPSCSPATQTCVCRIKDPGNLLVNPGFDGSLSGWDTGGTSFTLQEDAEACAGSKSVYGVATGLPSQCVPVLASAQYYFGVKYTRGGSGDDYFTMDFYSSPGCAGNLLGSLTISVLPQENQPDWISASRSTTSPVGSQSARFRPKLYLRGMDQAYFGSANKF